MLSRTCKGTARSIALATLLVIVMMLAACTNDSGEQRSVDEQPLPDGDWSAEQAAVLLQMVEDAKEVLPRHFPVSGEREDVEAELEEIGFRDFGKPMGGYTHYVNVPWVLDDRILNPEFPENLVYRESEEGSWKLEAVMYVLGRNDSIDTLPDLISWMPGWHVHPELCTWSQGPDMGLYAGTVDPEDSNEQCPEGSIPLVNFPMMHVWIAENRCHNPFAGVGLEGPVCSESDHHDHG